MAAKSYSLLVFTPMRGKEPIIFQIDCVKGGRVYPLGGSVKQVVRIGHLVAMKDYDSVDVTVLGIQYEQCRLPTTEETLAYEAVPTV